MLNSSQMECGRSISNERKILLKEIYSMFGKYDEFKLRKEIFETNYSIRLIFGIPELLFTFIMYKLYIPKENTKKWFKETYLENS